MRVVHVAAFKQFNKHHDLTFGGLERVLDELLPAQRMTGLDVDRIDVSADVLAAASDAIDARDWRRVGETGLNALGGMQADVFHFHDWYGGVALESLFRSGHRGIVFTSHLPLRRGFTYRDAGMTWKQKYLLEDRSIRAARVVTAPSAYVQRFLIDEYGLPEDRTEVVPHGVDLANFAPRSLAPTGGVRLLSVGRMTEQKGFGLLVRAFPRILASEPDASLTLIGDGGQRDSLARLIHRLDLNSAVSLLPTQSKAELAMVYAQADLLVMPSQFEPFGLVGLEAMACGCPVHALRPSGAQEYLLAGEMSDSYSPPRLAQAIIQRIQGLRQTDGAAAAIRRRAEAFTWKRAARSYERIYRESIR